MLNLSAIFYMLSRNISSAVQIFCTKLIEIKQYIRKIFTLRQHRKEWKNSITNRVLVALSITQRILERRRAHFYLHSSFVDIPVELFHQIKSIFSHAVQFCTNSLFVDNKYSNCLSSRNIRRSKNFVVWDTYIVSWRFISALHPPYVIVTLNFIRYVPYSSLRLVR